MQKNIALVGASSGIGLELARKYSKEGYKVWAFSREEKDLKSLPGIVWSHWDVNHHFPMLENMPDTLSSAVYCPGTINLKPFHRFTESDFIHDFHINVIGAIKFLQKVHPLLRAHGSASALLFSSVAANVGMSFHSSISASKGALEGLMRSLAAEWAPYHVRVNAISLSLTNTPLAASLLNTPEKIESAQKRHPINQIGDPGDIAELAYYLSSEHAKFITGQVFMADGGIGNLK